MSHLGKRGHNQRERKRLAESLIVFGVTIACAIAWGVTGGVTGLVASCVLIHFIDHSESALK